MVSGARGTFLAALALAAAFAVPAASAAPRSGDRSTVRTDGRLRPGHLESIWVRGFPGRGPTEVSFFPTAICEDECGVPLRFGGRTDSAGAGRLRVRVPNGFYNSKNQFTPFRDRERIDVNVIWIGPEEDELARASAHPDPIIVRVHPGANHVGARRLAGPEFRATAGAYASTKLERACERTVAPPHTA